MIKCLNGMRKPTKILLMKKDIDYVMCIDENGSSSNLTYVLKQISKDKEVSEMISTLPLLGVFLQERIYGLKKNNKVIKK